MKNRILFSALGILAFASCDSNDANNFRQTYLNNLTGKEGIKYWDIVYHTDVYGRSYDMLRRNEKPGRKGKPVYCDKFEKSGKVTHYVYLDSLHVRELGCSDVIVNPDEFVFKSDSTIHFQGHDYLIDMISKEAIVLKFLSPKGKLSTTIYLASRVQDKKWSKCQ